MKGIKYTFLVFISIFTISSSNAQNGEQNTDFETWTSLGAKKKIKKYSFEAEAQLRMKDNSSALDQYMFNFITGFEIGKSLSLAAGYRYFQESKKDGMESGQRFHIDMNSGFKLDRVEFVARLRYQEKYELNTLKKEGIDKVRFKAGIGYNIKNWKLDPEFSAELFHLLQDGNSVNQKMRYTLRTKYKIKGSGSFAGFYRYEQSLDKREPSTSHILGFRYTFKL